MLNRIILFLVFIFATATHAIAQSATYADKINNYVNRFKLLAIADQKRSGIPASITLAQGIVETEAGTSELMTQANNHFGIKCKNGWNGPTYTHTDDKPDECFRKYNSASESFKDHSDYLKTTPRYASLFKLSVTDYAGWAIGLKQCGYATNPQYAQRIIQLIEDFRLQEYTYDAMGDVGISYTPKNTNTRNVSPETASSNEKYYNDLLSKADSQQNERIRSIEKKILDTAASKRTINPWPEQNNNPRALNTAPSGIANAKLAEKVPIKPLDTTAKIAVQQTKKDTIYTRPKASTVADPATAQTSVPANNALLTKLPPQPKVVNNNELNDRLNNKSKADSPTVSLKQKMDNRLNGSKPQIPATTNNNTGNFLQTNEYKPVFVHGVKAIFCHKGDMLLDFAVKQNIRYAKLLEMNDLQDAPLENDMYVYLEKKGTSGFHSSHVVLSEETLLDIAQAECIQMKNLLAFNHLEDGEQPITGSKLYLQQEAPKKPLVIRVDQYKSKPLAENKFVASKGNYVNKPTPVADKTPVKTVQPLADTAKKNVKTPQQNPIAKKTPQAEAPKPVVNIAKNDDDDTKQGPPTESKTDLTRLKAKLDRVVYAKDMDEREIPKTSNAVKAPTEQKAPQPAVPDPKDAQKYYTVQEGDTAFKIARKFGITIRQLQDWNSMDFNQIKTGMRLKVKP